MINLSLTHIYTHIYILFIYLSQSAISLPIEENRRQRGREESKEKRKEERRRGKRKEEISPRESSPKFSATERALVSDLTHVILIYVDYVWI